MLIIEGQTEVGNAEVKEHCSSFAKNKDLFKCEKPKRF